MIVEIKVMQYAKPETEHLSGFYEMPDISPAVHAAGRTHAALHVSAKTKTFFKFTQKAEKAMRTFGN